MKNQFLELFCAMIRDRSQCAVWTMSWFCSWWHFYSSLDRCPFMESIGCDKIIRWNSFYAVWTLDTQNGSRSKIIQNDNKKWKILSWSEFGLDFYGHANNAMRNGNSKVKKNKKKSKIQKCIESLWVVHIFMAILLITNLLNWPILLFSFVWC